MPAAAPDDGRWTRLLLPGSRYYLQTLAFFVVVFAIIPFSIYAHSGEDWGFAFFDLLSIVALGLALFLGVALLIRLVAALHARTASTMAVALFCLGVFLLLAHVYAPIQIGPLDGAEIVSDEPLGYTVLEFALTLMLVLVFIQLRRNRGLTVAAAFSFFLILVSIAYGGLLALANQRETPHEHTPTNGRAEIDGNVYHIVLDSMRTDIFLGALERASMASEFAGFDLFKNNVSNYITTIPSAASFFSGTLYKTGEYKHWLYQWRRKGIFAALSDRGYQIWMYAPFEGWKNKHIDRFWYNLDIYQQDRRLDAHPGFYDLIYIWLASLAPNVFTNEVLAAAGAIRQRIFEFSTGRSEPLSFAELQPLAGEAVLRRLLREETLRAPSGQYVYAHATLPHAPFVFDRDCRHVSDWRNHLKAGRDAYLEQAQCAVKLVAGFLEELKRLGRYEEGTIVVHADTGHGVSRVGIDTGVDGPTTLGTSNAKLRKAINAFLMIKQPRSKAPLRIVDTPTQLVDVFPTVLDILNAEPPQGSDGRSVYSTRRGERRQASFGFDPSKKYGREFIQVRIEDPTNLEHSKLTVLGPATDPATWRTADDRRAGQRTGVSPESRQLSPKAARPSSR